ncbi:SET domain-containing protein SmydA-8 [Episyrphus balteatus]|uniref:SET domain-containing protein SmydA-8 n=1 Tax=Episyrphus balteatus TaxID=286459 RepID=UPI00248516BE|nr:SET domain-containing protein SmydA-8 [Episyrphus balteatus]
MSEESGNCAVCKIPAKQFCSACKSVSYCGAEHQKAHWKTHKSECRPFKIAKSDELGRFLIATRDIKADQVVFTEAPLVVGPKWYLSKSDEMNPVMPCVGCFTPCRVDGYQCPRCKWPVCSLTCAGLQNPKLHGVECSVLMLGNGPANRDIKSLNDYYRSDSLFVLKCLLLQVQNTKKWSELMDMQSHEEERLNTELYQEAQDRIVTYLHTNYLQKLKHLENKKQEKFLQHNEPDVLHKICGIIETNYMCINLPSGLELSGVFYIACMMEHTCHPNCYFQFDHRNGFKISVVAGRDIRKGEHLQIMYSNMLWGTQMRHEHLQITKHFLCQCDRCRDPTEFQTYFSGMICVGDVGKECGGIQLPKDPLSAKTDWMCDTCPMVISGEEVRFLLTQINEDVERILATKPTILQLEALIEKLSQFLHPNHYQIFALKHSLIQLYGTQSGFSLQVLTEEILEKKMKMCNELLAICDKLDPFTIRLSIYVGIILLEMHSVLKEEARRLLENTPTGGKQALDKLNLARDYLKRAIRVLKKELDSVVGKKLNDTVEKAIQELDYLIVSYLTRSKFEKVKIN